MRFAVLALVVFAAAACADNPNEPSDAGTSAQIDAASPADSGEPPPSCTCDPEEDCIGCIQHIGTCCYDDLTISGQAANIASVCAQTPSCKACCNECVRKSCDELKANKECPNLQ